MEDREWDGLLRIDRMFEREEDQARPRWNKGQKKKKNETHVMSWIGGVNCGACMWCMD